MEKKNTFFVHMNLTVNATLIDAVQNNIAQQRKKFVINVFRKDIKVIYKTVFQLIKQSQQQRISLQDIPQVLQEKFGTLNDELKKAIQLFEKFDSPEIKWAIAVAVRCHNNLIQEEVKYFLYEERERNFEYINFKSHMDRLEQSYEFVDEDYLLKTFIIQGDNLNQPKHVELALKYYDQALAMTQNYDKQFEILKKKYEMLLNYGYLQEASQIFTKLATIPTFSPSQFLVIEAFEVGILKFCNKAYFRIIQDLFRRLLRHIDDTNICEVICLIRYREFDKALTCISEITDQNSHYKITSAPLKIFCLIRQQKLSEAIKFIDEILKDFKDQELTQVKQWLLLISGAPDQAIFQIDNPQLKSIYHCSQSFTLARQENMIEAIEQINTALITFPKLDLIVYLKGILLIQAGKDKEANDIFIQIKIDDKDELQKCLQSSILRYQNQNSKSQELLLQVEKFLLNHLSFDDYQKVIWLEKWTHSFIKDGEGNLQIAYNILKLVKPFDRESYLLAALKAVTLVHLKKLNEAEKEIAESILLLKLSPYRQDKFYLLFIQGCILAQNHKYQDALNSFNETIKLCPNFARANACGALMLIKIGQYKQAFEYLNNPILKEFKDASIQYNLGQLFKLFKEFYTVLNLNLNLLKLNFRNLTPYGILNCIQLSRQQRGKIKQHNLIRKLQRSLTIIEKYTFQKEQQTTINLLKSLALIGQRNYQEALNILNVLIQQYGGDWRMHLCKAFTLMCKQSFQQAYDAIQIVLQNQGENSLRINNFLNALILMKLGQDEEANLIFQVMDPQLQKDQNSTKYKVIIEQNKTALLNDSIEFLLLQIVSVMESMKFRDEVIQLRKSKIEWWLLCVDFNVLSKNLWNLFNYDQKQIERK